MKNYSILITLFVILSSMPVQGKYITPLTGEGVSVTQVFIHENGAVSIMTAGETLNTDNCNNTTRWYIPQTLPSKDAMVSIALAALASGKTIGGHASGCAITQFWGGSSTVPVVNNLWIFNN